MAVERGDSAGSEIINLASDQWRDVSEEESKQTQEWQKTSEAVADNPEAEAPPVEPQPSDNFIDLEQADNLVGTRAERQKAVLEGLDLLHQKSQEEVASRYKLNEGGKVTQFIRQTKAFFAGEFADLKLSERLAELEPDQQAEELKKTFRLFTQEGARRLGKVITKTGVSGGIGTGIATLLGGAVASPVFLGALAGGAAARGAFEVYRHFKKDEREGRTKIVMERAKVYAEGAKLQDQAQALLAERDSATPERQEAIDQEIDALHQYLIDLAHYESYQALYGENEAEKELVGLAKVSDLAHEKMRLEKKREKVADLVAAGGSLLGGIYGQVVQSNLLETNIQKAHGFIADFNKDHISHFVEKINPGDIAASDPGFKELLAKNGGYVFQYNSNEIAKVLSPELAQHLTTATLKDGSVVHTLSGLSDNAFRNLLLQSRPELAQQAASLAGSFWKEAVPLVGANLLMAVEYLSGLTGKNRPNLKENTVEVSPAERLIEGKEPLSVEPPKISEKTQPEKATTDPQAEINNLPVPVGSREAEVPEAKSHESVKDISAVQGAFNRIFERLQRLKPDTAAQAGIDLSEESDERSKRFGERTLILDHNGKRYRYHLGKTKNGDRLRVDTQLRPFDDNDSAEVRRIKKAYIVGVDNARKIDIEILTKNISEALNRIPPPEPSSNIEEKKVPIAYVSKYSEPPPAAIDPKIAEEPTVEKIEPKLLVEIITEKAIDPAVFETGRSLKFREFGNGERVGLIDGLKEEFGITGSIDKISFKIVQTEPIPNDINITIAHGGHEASYPLSALLELNILKLPKSATKKK